MYPFNSGQSSGFCRGLASATVCTCVQVQSMEVSHHANSSSQQHATLESLSDSLDFLSATGRGNKDTTHTVYSCVSEETKKCQMSCSLWFNTKGLISVTGVFAVGGQKVVSVFLPRWPKTDIWRQTNALCYLLPSLNPQLQDFLGPSVLCHKTGSCCRNGFMNVYRRSVILRHGKVLWLK